MALMSPALTGGFFTTSSTWEAQSEWLSSKGTQITNVGEDNSTLLVGMQTVTATVENSMEVSQKKLKIWDFPSGLVV